MHHVMPYLAMSAFANKKGQKMAEWVNAGVRNSSDASDIPTKKALKEQLSADPTSVTFYATSDFPPNHDDVRTADRLLMGHKYSVTGPNPYTSRKWYATVERLENGKITVK